MISNRLKRIASYVSNEDRLIDIGCDHALLDIYLVKNKILDKVIVSDVHEGALNAGVSNIKKEKLSKKIETRLGNGMEVLSDKDDINTVLISGMGTTTILDILNNNYLKNINKLIIQSNNDHTELRIEVTKLGYIVKDEEYLVDMGKNYIIIVFEKGNKKYTKDELRYGPILIKDKAYLNFELNQCIKIKNFIPTNKVILKFRLNKEIRHLKKLIKRCGE
jgi:tRNA (adenine22-N1)-methyltransferase